MHLPRVHHSSSLDVYFYILRKSNCHNRGRSYFTTLLCLLVILINSSSLFDHHLMNTNANVYFTHRHHATRLSSWFSVAIRCLSSDSKTPKLHRKDTFIDSCHNLYLDICMKMPVVPFDIMYILQYVKGLHHHYYSINCKISSRTFLCSLVSLASSQSFGKSSFCLNVIFKYNQSTVTQNFKNYFIKIKENWFCWNL